MALSKSFASSGGLELGYVAFRLGVDPNELGACSIIANGGAGSDVLPNDFWSFKYLDLVNSLYTADYDDTSRAISYKGYGTITFSSSQSWATPFNSSITGVGSGTMSFLFSENTLKAARSTTITLTRGSESVTTILTQDAAPADFIPISLGDSLSDGNSACSDYAFSPTTRYIPNGQTFVTATSLKSNSSGTSAPAGYYSDGTKWRYWTGAVFTTTGNCTI